MTNLSRLYPAYAKYLVEHYPDAYDLSRALIIDARDHPHSVVWQWLEECGKPHITQDTFIYVATKLLWENRKRKPKRVK